MFKFFFGLLLLFQNRLHSNQELLTRFFLFFPMNLSLSFSLQLTKKNLTHPPPTIYLDSKAPVAFKNKIHTKPSPPPEPKLLIHSPKLPYVHNDSHHNNYTY